MKAFAHPPLITTVLLLVADNIHAQKNSASRQTLKNTDTSFTYKIFKTQDDRYGYDIYRHDKLLIHQASIPTMPGDRGFATTKDASKVAELVIEKLKAKHYAANSNKIGITKIKSDFIVCHTLKNIFRMNTIIFDADSSPPLLIEEMSKQILKTKAITV
jgi:hypothetical protein